MKQGAPWIVAIAFSAIAGAAVAADGDSMRSDTSVSEDTQSSSPPPGGGGQQHGTEASSAPTTSTYETHAADNPATGSYEAKGRSRSSDTSVLPSFSEVDRNGDGQLSWSEANDAGINFTAADRDTDGRISNGEYESAIHQIGGRGNTRTTPSGSGR